jgi:cytidylate kinase
VSPLIHVAIDGPAGAGKGTVTKELSKRLGIPCLDTGAVYRGVAVLAKRMGGAETIVNLISGARIVARIVDNVTRVYLDGEDITGHLRENDISQITAKVATIPAVRKFCTKIFQELASHQSMIVEGRDICTEVLPNAQYKFFLTASAEERAKRRHKELEDRGALVEYKQIFAEIVARDEMDSSSLGGLRRHPSATVIDSTKITPAEVVQKILGEIK